MWLGLPLFICSTADGHRFLSVWGCRPQCHGGHSHACLWSTMSAFLVDACPDDVELLGHGYRICSVLGDVVIKFSKVSCASLHSHQLGPRVLQASHSCQYLVVSVFFILAHAGFAFPWWLMISHIFPYVGRLFGKPYLWNVCSSLSPVFCRIVHFVPIDL